MTQNTKIDLAFLAVQQGLAPDFTDPLAVIRVNARHEIAPGQRYTERQAKYSIGFIAADQHVGFEILFPAPEMRDQLSLA